MPNLSCYIWKAKVLSRAFAAVVCALFASVLAAGVLVSAPAQAYAGELTSPDPNRGISLVVKDHHDDAFIKGTRVDIYRVATMSASGALTSTENFANLPVSWHVPDKSHAAALAATLQAFVVREAIAPTDFAVTSTNGTVSFPSGAQALQPGYYLILAQPHKAGNAWHTPVASLVALPYVHEDGSKEYSPIMSLKYQEHEGQESLDVTKVWEGKNVDHPAQVAVQLLRNGEVHRTAVLNEDNGWHVQWTGLDAQYSWAVLEESVPDGYTISVTQDGGIVTVTNTCPDQPAKPETPVGNEPEDSSHDIQSLLPQTGQLWWPVTALLMAGVVLLGAGLSRKLRR